MFSTLKNAFKDKEIRNKIYFTLFILLIYRIGANITVPGVNAKAITQVAQTGLVPMPSATQPCLLWVFPRTSRHKL